MEGKAFVHLKSAPRPTTALSAVRPAPRRLLCLGLCALPLTEALQTSRAPFIGHARRLPLCLDLFRCHLLVLVIGNVITTFLPLLLSRLRRSDALPAKLLLEGAIEGRAGCTTVKSRQRGA